MSDVLSWLLFVNWFAVVYVGMARFLVGSATVPGAFLVELHLSSSFMWCFGVV